MNRVGIVSDSTERGGIVSMPRGGIITDSMPSMHRKGFVMVIFIVRDIMPRGSILTDSMQRRVD